MKCRSEMNLHVLYLTLSLLMSMRNFVEPMPATQPCFQYILIDTTDFWQRLRDCCSARFKQKLPTQSSSASGAQGQRDVVALIQNFLNIHHAHQCEVGKQHLILFHQIQMYCQWFLGRLLTN